MLANSKEFAAMNRLIKHIGFCAAMLAGSTAVAGITFYDAENFGGRQIGGSEAMPNFQIGSATSWARPVSSPQANLQPPAVGSPLPGRVTFYESENFGGRQIGGSEAMPNF